MSGEEVPAPEKMGAGTGYRVASGGYQPWYQVTSVLAVMPPVGHLICTL